MAKGKQIGEFSLKFTSFAFAPGPAGSTVIACNCEGPATGYGTVVGTLTAVVGKSGTVTWCGAAYLENGEIVTANGSGTHESCGKHRWRIQVFIQISDGSSVITEGELDLAARSWTGKIFEND